MNTKDQIICAWGGPAFMVFFFLGWGVFSGLIPPHLPTWGGAEVASFYQASPVQIRLGLLISLLSTAFLFPFTAVISVQMARIEGRFPVWACVQLAAGGATVLTFDFPAMFWAVAAFRPDRSPELLLLLNDLAWVPFMALTVPFIMVPISIAIVGFKDKSEHPIFPRWACFFNLWATVLILPGSIIIFFKTGPFAWNGLFGWWIPVIIFGIWFATMTFLLTSGIKRQALEEASTQPATA